MRKINEIFYSLQGEGYFTGTPAVFVRFSGCNLKCAFCDTDHEGGVEMTDEEIVERAKEFGARHIVLTGGEPSLWIDEEFVGKLKAEGFFVQIETNGTRALPKNIDWVTCSPKGARLMIEEADEVKIVFEGEESARQEMPRARHRFLQPVSCKNTAEVVEYILRHTEWRLSLQTHKLIDIR